MLQLALEFCVFVSKYCFLNCNNNRTALPGYRFILHMRPIAKQNMFPGENKSKILSEDIIKTV